MRRILLGLLLCPMLVAAADLDTARALLEQQRYAEARPMLERALDDPATRAQATVLLTWLYNGLEDWRQSVRLGERAIELMPDNAMAHHQYAIALRVRMTQISKMRAIFSLGEYREALDRAIELDPGNVEARTERIGYLINAPGFAGGDREQGAREIGELIEIDWRMGMHMKAELKIIEDRPEEAISIFEQMLSRNPQDLQAHLDLGLLLQDLKRHQAAASSFGRIIEINDSTTPDPAQAVNRAETETTIMLNALLGRATSRAAGSFELDGASVDLERYVSVEGPLPTGLPSRSEAWLSLGDVNRGLGRLTEARSAYSKALDLDPDNKRAKQRLKSLGGR